MVTLQFYLTKYNRLVTGESNESGLEVKAPSNFSGSITIPGTTKDNLIEYITHRRDLLDDDDLYEDNDEYLTALTEMSTLPITVDRLYLIREPANEGEDPVILRAFDIGITHAYGTTVHLQIWFASDPSNWEHGESVDIVIDIATNSITSFKFNGGYELIDEWDYNKAVITEVSGSGPAGWTGKDGYVDNDKSLESAFISNAKPGNAGSTATYRQDEDGYYYLYSVEG